MPDRDGTGPRGFGKGRRSGSGKCRNAFKERTGGQTRATSTPLVGGSHWLDGKGLIKLASAIAGVATMLLPVLRDRLEKLSYQDRKQLSLDETSKIEIKAEVPSDAEKMDRPG